MVTKTEDKVADKVEAKTDMTVSELKKKIEALPFEELTQLYSSMQSSIQTRAKAELNAMHERENKLREMAGMKKKPGGPKRVK